MKIIAAIGALLLFTSCKTTFYKDGATQSDYASDMQSCDYEVSLHTNSYDNSMNTAVGQGIEMGMRRKELIIKCMGVKGWTTAAPKQ